MNRLKLHCSAHLFTYVQFVSFFIFSLFGQSFEYFALRAKLVEGLSQATQEELDFGVSRQLETECDWLENFLSSVSQRYDLLRLPSRTDTMPDLRPEAIPEQPPLLVAEPSGPFESLDECVLSGHLLLMHSLLTCEGVDKQVIGVPSLELELIHMNSSDVRGEVDGVGLARRLARAEPPAAPVPLPGGALPEPPGPRQSRRAARQVAVVRRGRRAGVCSRVAAANDGD